MVDSKVASRSSTSWTDALNSRVLSTRSAGSDKSSSQEVRGIKSPKKNRAPANFKLYFSMVVVLITCVLYQFGVPVDLDLWQREKQMFLACIVLTDGVQKIQTVLSVVHPDQVEPTLALEGQFDPAFLEHCLSKGHLVQPLGDVLQIGTSSYLVEIGLGLSGPAQFVQGLRFHQQHIGIAQHRKVHGAVVITGDLAQGHQEFAHIVARKGIFGQIGLAVKIRTALIEHGGLFSQVPRLVLVHELLGGLVPTIAPTHEVGAPGAHKRTGPGSLVFVGPEIKAPIRGVLYLEDGFL